MSPMTTKTETLNSITDEVFKLNPSYAENTKKQQLADFIYSAVNGDNPIAFLVINANLEANTKGTIAYILTDLRLIKIDISPNEIKSNSYPMNTITSVERKLIDGEREQFGITFQNGAFGLKYSKNDKKISDFFQRIDQGK